MRVKIIRSEVLDGAVYLKDEVLDLPVETADALIAEQIGIALDPDELVFEPVSDETEKEV